MPGWLSSTQRWRVSAGIATQWTADTVCELLARPVVVATAAATATPAAAADPLLIATAATAASADGSTSRPAGSATDGDGNEAHFRFDAAWWAKLGDDLWRRPRVLQWLDAQCVTDSAPTPTQTDTAAANDAFDANEAAARLLNNLQDP